MTESSGETPKTITVKGRAGKTFKFEVPDEDSVDRRLGADTPPNIDKTPQAKSPSNPVEKKFSDLKQYLQQTNLTKEAAWKELIRQEIRDADKINALLRIAGHFDWANITEKDISRLGQVNSSLL